jgi:methanogenic corrinoid protein MtbC1
MEREPSSPQTPPQTPDQNLLAELAEKIDALDRAGAVRRALEAVRSGEYSIPDLYVRVLGPYLTRVGVHWQQGTEAVWQEHFASHVVRTIVEALYPSVAELAQEASTRGETILLVCPPGEAHELGLRMLADRFELAGYRSILLGADTPVREIIAAGRTTHADIIAISVSTVFERLELRDFIDDIQSGLPSARVLIGGPAFAAGLASWADDGLLDPAELGLPGSLPTS